MPKSIRNLTLGPLAIVAALVVLAAVPAHGAAILMVDPSSTTIPGPLGQTFTLDIDISGVTDLYSFAFSVNVDPDVLSITSVTEGSFLSGGGETTFLPGTIDGEGNVFGVSDTLVGPVPGVSGDGTLATITFTTVGGGTTPVDIFSVKLFDSLGNPIVSGSPGQGSVTVTTSVPEPASWALLGLGLAGLSLLRKRKQRA